MKREPTPKKLEALLKSSALVAGGFLGTDPRPLAEIIEADQAELAALGVSTAQLATAMEAITRAALKGQGTPVSVGLRTEAVADESRGSLVCPWGCNVRPDKTVTTVTTSPGVQVCWSDLSIHLIAAHGFFQGRGSSYRTEPRDLASLLTSHVEPAMDSYICKVCGHVYDPKQGDETNNIPVNTPFDKLPEGWKCPLCGAPKRMFKKKK